MLHARGQFLADITTLGEGNAVQFFQPGIQGEDLLKAEIAGLEARAAALKAVL